MRDAEIAALLDGFQGTYTSFVPNDHTFTAWQKFLGDLPAEAVTSALDRISPEYPQFAPTPVAIRNAVMEQAIGLESGEEAWAIVEKAISQRGSWYGPDPDWPVTIARAVNALDWTTMCQTDVEDMGYLRKDFLRFYEAFREQAMVEARAALGTGMKEIAG